MLINTVILNEKKEFNLGGGNTQQIWRLVFTTCFIIQTHDQTNAVLTPNIGQYKSWSIRYRGKYGFSSQHKYGFAQLRARPANMGVRHL